MEKVNVLGYYDGAVPEIVLYVHFGDTSVRLGIRCSMCDLPKWLLCEQIKWEDGKPVAHDYTYFDFANDGKLEG